MASSSSSSPCAACKFLRRKCTPECVFAPYFPPDQPHKFANVHKIFGASNITKLLNELPVHQREDAVNSLAYEADARVKDPVYGCVGAISMLQRQVARLQHELALAQQDLARYTSGAVGLIPPQQHPQQPQPPQPVHHPQHQPQVVHSVGLNVSHGGMGIGHEMFARDHLTREQVMDIARIGGGSYETGLAVLGLNPVSLGPGGGGGVSAGQFVAPTPSSRTSGSDTSGAASSSSGGGGGFYH